MILKEIISLIMIQSLFFSLKSKCGASTIIVLPEGIESFRIKKELEDIWDWNRILVLSEFMHHDKWTAGRAMLPNNTIIGLSEPIQNV